MLLPFDKHVFQVELEELDQWKARLDAAAPFAAPAWAGRLRRDLEAEAVAASTRMEGVKVTLDEVRRILGGDPPPEVKSEDRALVEGYRDAMRFVFARAEDPHFEWSRELIIGLHDRVMRGDSVAGRIRVEPTAVISAETGALVFTPPEHDPAEWTDRLCAEMHHHVDPASADPLHPALSAAWVHIAFAAVHPFRNGNGRTARVLASSAMYRGGFRLPFFTSLEEWWGRHARDYYAAFNCLGSVFNPDADVTAFVQAHLRAQLAQVRAFDLRERSHRALWSLLENLVDARRLNQRTTSALWEAFFGRPITSVYYAEMTDVSPATARNDLTGLQAAGFVLGEGRTRARQWKPQLSAVTTPAEALGLSPPADADDARRLVIAEIAERLLSDQAMK